MNRQSLRLLSYALALGFSVALSPAQASPLTRSLSVSSTARGVRISLSVPKQLYHRGSWIDAVVKVKNVSRAQVRLNGYPQSCWEQASNGANPTVQEQDPKGRWVYPPKLAHVPPCRPPAPFTIRPGKTVRTLIYAPARAQYLIAVVSLRVRGRHGKSRAVAVRTPRLHILVQ